MKKTSLPRQAHYMRIILQNNTFRGLSESTGIDRSRLMRIADGSTPIYAWEVHAITEATNIKIFLSTAVMNELRNEYLDQRFPDRHQKVARLSDVLAPPDLDGLGQYFTTNHD